MADFRNKYPNETTDIDASLEAAATTTGCWSSW